MKLPLELSFHGVERRPAIERLIREKTEALERVCDYMNSCRIAVEQTSDKPTYHVRIEMTLPPGKNLAVSRDPGEIDETDLETVIHNAFAAARRKLKRTVEKQRNETKRHPEQEVAGVVEKIFHKEGFGFIRSFEADYNVYFHRNSVVNQDFATLQPGAGVEFTEVQGEQGPQASTVRVLDHAEANRSA